MATSGNNANFNVTIGANMDPSGVLGAVKQMQGAFNGLKLPANMTGDVLKNFNKLTESLSKFEKLASQDHFSKTDVKSLQKLQKEINSVFGELKGSLTDLSGHKFYLEADYTKIKEARHVVDQLKADIQTKLSNIKIDFSSAKGGTASLGLDTLLSRMEQGVKTSKTLSAAMSEMGNSIRTGNLSAASEQFTQMISKAKGLKGASAELLDTFKQWGLVDFSGPASNIKSMEERGRLLNQVFDKLVPIFSKNGEAVGQLSEELTTATDKVKDLEKAGIENYTNSISNGVQKTEELENAARQTGQATVEMADGMRRASDEVKQLQQSTQYFFSLRNMINLLKRGIREAVDVVKELDAAMTETAVVTDFSVGDMWKKLPEYTANANALGASVKDMYEATTLYYQQGLDTNAAMGIANETMKMARIGGLEAADATDKMTAALRGFNMELNEVSAQRVNDVYSNLAAKTASNTEELGTAMQRTASIAASAGMSFEGTAAFLAQAIETTREPAENLGTAMKTIVARFTELKKNPLEISEVDGEEVDYNKVDTALKSIGVSLKDTNGQFRNLDQVFLDISERWDSLTQTQQRYIATTAAGSRQQSRFIAMMSNYERTMQLMDYANNSAGASTEQFGKTMESLEAKINKLKNAWNKFLMSIMNDSWTKGIVDGTTKVLNIVTTLIDKLSFGQKGIKSVLSLFTAFTALKLTGRGANALIGGLGGLIDPNSSFKEGLRGGALGGQAAKISSPIVKAIYDLIPHIDKAVANEAYKYQQYGNFKEAQRDLRAQLFSGEKSLDKYSFSGVYAAVEKNKLNTEQQNALFKSFPGLKKNMTKALSKMLQEYGTDPQTARNLAQGFKKGKIPFDKALEKSGMLLSFGQKMAQIEEKEGQAAAKKFQRDERQRLSREQRQNILNAGKKEGYTGKELQEYYVNETNKALQSNGYAANKKAEELLNSNQTLTTAERAANTFGRLGGALTSAGMSMQMLGSQVSAINPLLGTLITKAGGLVSAVGTIPNLISSVIAGGPAIWAITAAITALGLVIYDVQKRANNIKNTAAKVTEAFKDTNKETQDNINSLKQYQEQAAIWAKGVDSYGNNINLSDEDYNQYLQAVDKIAKINPSIVQGYNAQGHAIVNINKALSETIELEKKRQEDAFKQYLDPASLDKIVRARNIDNNFQAATLTLKYDKGSLGDWFFGEEGNFGFNLGEWIDKTFDSNLFTKKTAAFTDEVTEIIENLQKDLDTSDLTEFFKPFNIDWEKLSKNDSTEIQKFVKNREAIYSAALKQSGGELSNKLADSFTTLDTNAEGFTESINATLEWLSTYVSNSPAFADLSAEIQAGINQSLENIAIQPDLTATEMQSQADILIKKFERLTSTNSQYNEALRIAQDAQTKFANSLDETQYDVDITPALEKLNTLKQTALQEETAYGDALAQYLENQIQRISKFTTEGGANLTEALNTATDEIAAAEGALDSFNEATKKDFSTAAEGMKGIFDKTTETFKDSYGTEIQKHAEGMGDATFWTGAEALLSEKEIERLTKGKNGYDAAEAVAKKIKGLEPMLREGQEGFDAFTDRVLENADAMDKLAEAGVTYDKESGFITNIPDDQWHNVAEALGISDDLLTSMINKGRQFANISFMNVEEARKALAASEYTIKGTTAKNGEQQNLYVKESTLRQQLSDAGYVRKEQQDQQIQKLQKEQNVKTLKAADEYKKGSKELVDAFKDMGVKTLPDLIETLNATGDFNKDEIQAYAEKAGLMGSQERYDSLYSSIIEAAQNPELAKQTDLLGQINAQVAALRDNRTGAEAKSDYDKFHNELYGGKGHDTAAQKFGDGLNKEGKQLTAGEYEQTKKDLEESAQAAREQAAIARERAKTERGLEKERWENIAKYYDQDADYIDKLLDRGAKAFEEKQKEIDQQIKANESKTKGKQKEAEEQEKIRKAGEKKAKESYAQRGFGNTDADNRQVLRWGANPEQNKNFAAAKTWGWNARDLANSTSTYMSAGMTFGQGKNAVELTVTPMLQTPNGTPQVLSQDTVSQYFDQIVSKATDSNGKINIDKLFELDKEGLEVEGQEINNLLMGAFNGKGAREASDALAQIEHQLEADKLKAQDLNKAAKQIGKQEKRTQEQTPKKPETPTPQKVQESKDTGREQQRTIKTVFEVEGDDKLDNAENKFDALSVAASSPFGVYIQTHDSTLAESLGLINQVQETANEEANVVINGDASGAVAAGASAASAIAAVPSKHNTTLTATDNVSSKLSSIGAKIADIARKAASVVVGGGGAVGINNRITTTSLPTFASAARGKGKVGPKNKGGLTLTGEKGFEIAWLPSENRSMILGAGGPQMLNLPSDAVVYTHEQSKDIIKRKGIPAGSHADYSGSGYQKKYNNSIVTTVATTGTHEQKEKSTDKSITQAVKEITKITQKAGKVLVWWENAARRMDKAQHNADIIQKKLESLLKEFGTTGDKYREAGKEYEKYLKQQQDIANQQKTRADKELKMTDMGRSQVHTATVDKARKNLQAAKDKYNKHKTKKNKKTLQKAQKKYNKQADSYLSAVGARQEISYEVTKKTKKNGKWKKTKETKKANVNLAKYIKKDPVTGEYQIDQAAIDKIAKTNKSKAQAIADAADKQLNDLISKQQAAEKAAIEAAEALDDFYNETYETFGGWERTITQAYLLAQDLEKLSSLRTIYDDMQDLEFAKLEAGFSEVSKSLPIINNALQKNKDLMLQQVQANEALVQAKYKEFQASLDSTQQAENVARYGGTEAAADYDAILTAHNFLQSIGQVTNFDYTAAVQELNQPEWKEKDYQKIQDGLDKIHEKQIAYYDALAQTYETMSEVYQTIEEYQSYMADFENTLIKGLEDQANKEIDKLSKLNTSLTDAAKNIIDEVKRKLDERRKQEDNAKTEQDISQKQQRLAALRADTSGGHQVEIAQLEKELAEARQNYGRTLEDQLLDSLSNQQDEAAKQREQQIALLEAQRDLAAAIGTNVDEVNKWLRNPAQNKEQIRAAWLENQRYNEAGANERKQLEEQFEVAWTKYLAYNTTLPELEQIATAHELPEEPEEASSLTNIQKNVQTLVDILSQPLQISSLHSVTDLKTDANRKERTLTEIKKIGEVQGQSFTAHEFAENDFNLSDITNSYSAKELHDEGWDLSQIKDSYTAQELKEGGYTVQDFSDAKISYEQARKAFSTAELAQVQDYSNLASTEDTYNQFLFDRGSSKSKHKNKGQLGADGLKAQIKRGQTLGYSEAKIFMDLAKTDELTWKKVITAAKKAKYKVQQLISIRDASSWSNKGKNNFGKAVNEVYGLPTKTQKKLKTNFLTGGLADFTGPAWLDGTPSKPELVLNARDTQNFIALKDVLAKAMNGISNTSNTYGDIMYEININVDKIEKDYDVDRVVDKVKKEIIKGAGYRNVTQVRNLR